MCVAGATHSNLLLGVGVNLRKVSIAGVDCAIAAAVQVLEDVVDRCRL